MVRILLLTLFLSLASSLVYAEEEGVVFAVGAGKYVLTPACAQRVDHALAENGLMHLRFDMPETPQCFGAFHRLLSSHPGDRLSVTFHGETLMEAELHTRLGPRNIVLVSRRPPLVVEVSRFLGGSPNREVP